MRRPVIFFGLIVIVLWILGRLVQGPTPSNAGSTTTPSIYSYNAAPITTPAEDSVARIRYATNDSIISAEAAAVRAGTATVEAREPHVTVHSWSEGGFGSVALLDLTITSPTPIKDVELTCHAYAPSGTELGQNVKTIYEIVKSKRRFREFNLGFINSQTQRIGCGISDFKRAY